MEESRIGFVGILIENRHQSAGEVNRILSLFGDLIRARLGMPWHDRGISVVTLVVEATTDQMGALAGALGRLPGVSVKTGLSKRASELELNEEADGRKASE